MNKMKKYIGILISILIVIIICFFIIISNLKNKVNTDVTDGENGDSNIEYKIEKVRDATQFFSVQKCIQSNINEKFQAKDMNILNEYTIISFAVYGEILDDSSSDSKDVYYIFRIDTQNDTFSIESIENEKIKNIDDIDLKNDITQIEDNGKNKMEYITVTDEQLSRMYYEDFSKLEINNPEKAYKLLDEKYKEERFPTLDEYKEYIESYKDIIKTGSISKYSRDIQDDYTECVLVDNYKNYYILKETSIMNYTIMLDNYTIKTDDYKEKYNELETENKIQANAHIFLQMINTKDYKHAYEVLDDSFKKNNFDTLDKFKQYVKNNFFDYNLNTSLTSEMSIEKQGEYYVYKTVVRNNSGSAAQSKEITIVMKILSGTDFLMSFSI